MTKFFNKLKKPCFLPIFGPFSQFLGQKHFFPENLALSCTELMIKLQCLDRWKNEQKDRQTLFFRTLAATCQGSKKCRPFLQHNISSPLCIC